MDPSDHPNLKDSKDVDKDWTNFIDDLVSSVQKGGKHLRSRIDIPEEETESETDAGDSEADQSQDPKDQSQDVDDASVQGSYGDSEASSKDDAPSASNENMAVGSRASGKKRHQGKSLPLQASKKAKKANKTENFAPEKKQRVGGRRRMKQKAYMST